MPYKVLIVDDETHIVSALQFLMQQAGYEVETTDDGYNALLRIEAIHPDIILLDVMLLSLDGFSVCQKIRANPAYDSIKIVMLTAKGQETDLKRGLEVGADRYITKPFSTRQLMQEIKSLLEESTR